MDRSRITEEILKCGKDPIYFITNYIKISNPMKGVILFNLFDFQRDLIYKFMNEQFNIILKARQLGASTTVAAYALWMMMFHRGRQIDVIATQRKTAAELVRKSRNMFKELPKWMQTLFPIGDIDNRHEFEFENGSRMSSHASTSSSARSYASSLLIFDEAAHIEGIDEVLEASLPILSTGGSCIAISTPNGIGNWFEETYTKAERGNNSFVASKLDWRVHPDRDEKWYQSTLYGLMNGDIEKFDQEYECSFLASGRTFLNNKLIQKMYNEISDPMYMSGHDGNFWIWEEPEKGKQYYLCADISRGDSEDFTTFHILSSDLNQVAEYQGKIPVDFASEFAVKIARDYNEAMIISEVNYLGYMFLSRIIEDGYENVYFSEKNTHKFVPAMEASYRQDIVPGISTTSQTRPRILANLEEYIRNGMVKINSKRLYDEFTTFIWTGSGKVEASSGKHDDLIFSIAMGCYAHQEIFKTYERDIKYDKALLDSIRVNRRKIQDHNDVIGINEANLSISMKTGDKKTDLDKKNRRKNWVVIL